MLYIQHATIYTPHHRLDDGALLIEADRIMALGPAAKLACPSDAQLIDAAGLLLAPGFIDLQLNGAFGHDFTTNPESIWPVAAGLPQYGVTSFLPTIITSLPETITAAQVVLTQGPPTESTGALPLGLHLEGPFLNPARKGAHNPAYLCLPRLDATANWSPEQGVRLVTLAPELPGALELIETLAGRGVVVSAGHSLADDAEAATGLEAGLRYGTHLFNAMPALHHRDPGLAGALLADSRPIIGLIVDGVHVHPNLVKLVWRLLGSSRLNLVTDAMAALGTPPGRYRLGDFEVDVDAASARLADGTLAGSILALNEALRNLMTFTGCSLGEALPTVTTTPATLLGLADRGELAPGAVADIVLFDPDLQIVLTLVGGQIVYSNGLLLPTLFSREYNGP
jgi:N-acetylglucosamine-6-phosphate deacetylase